MPVMTIPADATIIGGPHIGSHQLRLWLSKFTSYKGHYELDTLAECFATFGAACNVSDVLCLAQAAKETNWFTSENWLQRYNPAGLGTTGVDVHGFVFPSTAHGVAAQVGHLLNYALLDEQMTMAQLAFALLDPRRSVLNEKKLRGGAREWRQLGGLWAPSKEYGASIVTRANELLKGK